MSEYLISAGLIDLTRRLASLNAPVAHGALGGEHGYGAEFENSVFMMHPYCWCEKDECPWCGPEEELGQQTAPNFHHKATGFKVWWYKYIGRGMKVENPNKADFVKILAECCDSLKK